MRTKATLAALMVLASCAAAPAQDKLITPILWYQIDAYCAFYEKGHVIDYDNPDTWRFVFFTQFGPTGKLEDGAGFISIAHRLLQLRLQTNLVTSAAEVRTYVSYTSTNEPDPHHVIVHMTMTGEGEEYTNYAGTVTLNGPLGKDVTEFEGSCGV